MEVDQKGQGKEKEDKERSMSYSGMSTTLQIIYHNQLIYVPISEEPKIKLMIQIFYLTPMVIISSTPKACLIQQDYHDINKNLIPPWKNYEALTAKTSPPHSCNH